MMTPAERHLRDQLLAAHQLGQTQVRVSVATVSRLLAELDEFRHPILPIVPEGMVKAPWTLEQVAKLNDWQRGPTHEYTCKNSSHGPLVATTEGWRCNFCDYTQDWAHEFSIAWGGDL